MRQQALPESLLLECQAIAHLVAPELASGPLYVTSLPADYPDCGETMAFTTRGAADFAIRQMLIDERRWRGPGTVIAFCQPMSRDEALGLTLHEVAHAVPFTAPPADFEPSAELQAAQRRLVAKRLVRPVGDLPTMPAWYSIHGLKFVRRSLHLHARAWHAGFEIGLPMIGFAGPDYDLSPAWRYRRALGDEPQRMVTATFAKIDATAMPSEFRALFHADFQEWFERTREENSHVHAA